MADLTTQVLIEIRDEVRELRNEARATNARLDQTNARLGGLETRFDRLDKRQIEAEIRLSTEVVALTGVVRDLRDTLLEDRQLRQTVENHEQRLRALETKQ